jgi:uncharacterized repeat protein (TIGR01451 family)
MSIDGAGPCQVRGGTPRRLSRSVVVLLAIAIGATFGPITAARALPMTFGAGSLIVPMDVGANAQDMGALRAYGLVYALLRDGVPVYWAINPTKPAGGDDFALFAGTVTSVQDGTHVSLPRSYRGGPFVIRAEDRAAALPIVETWVAAGSEHPVVHDVVSGSFTADIARTLVAAPRIAILADGSEGTAFNDLNAAGIPDSTGAQWKASSSDLLAESQVVGPTAEDDHDGALFGPDGRSRYCQLIAMHTNPSSDTPEVVQEVRSWLSAGPFTHLFAQCQAAATFENDPSGHFVTTQGITDDGSPSVTPVMRLPADPLAQLDGPFSLDFGSLDSIGLAAGSALRPGVRTLIDGGSSAGSQMAWLSGRMDGSDRNGVVSYLAGHDYSTDLPITSNPQTNGVRLFLNGLFEALCAVTPVQRDMTLSLLAPAETTASTITYTLAYSNPGPRRVENVKLRDEIPAGAIFKSATGGATQDGGVVTWDVGAVPAGAGGSAQVTVAPSGRGTYSNRATADFAHLAVRRVASNTAATVVRAGRLEAPAVVDFGRQTRSTVGPEHVAVVRNPASPATGDSVRIERLAISGGDFVISRDACSGEVLGAGESCAVGLRFAPVAEGRRTGSMSVISDAVDGPGPTALNGRGEPAPATPTANTTPTGGTTPITPATPVDRSAPRITLSVARSKLGKILRRGQAVTVSCSEACDVTATLSVSRRTARKLRLASMRLARTASTRPDAGALRLNLRPAGRAARRLARIRRLPATLRVTATDPAGNAFTAHRKLGLRR